MLLYTNRTPPEKSLNELTNDIFIKTFVTVYLLPYVIRRDVKKIIYNNQVEEQ